MKKILLLHTLLLSLFLAAGCAEKPKPNLTENLKDGLRKDAKEFLDSLKNVLIKEMQTNGIVAAVAVCSDTAQILTVNYGFSKGIYIKRVSLKYRNPNNAPDGFESKVLNHFSELSSIGKLDQNSEFFEVINSDGVYSVRYMKPIFVQAPCLNCHGSIEQISSDVKAVIQNKYPDDNAAGYYLDDLRGAVSIQKTL